MKPLTAQDVANILYSIFANTQSRGVGGMGVPKDTGNLFSTLTVEVSSDFRAKITIGGMQAPYAPYTNEPWTKGTNPNEGYIENCLDHLTRLLASRGLGKVKWTRA